MTSSLFETYKSQMIKYCLYRERCWSEVNQKMEDLGMIEAFQSDMVAYLSQERYVNEERFASEYVRGKFNQNHWGKRKIQHQLIQKKVPTKLIQNALSEIDMEDYYNQIKRLFNNHWALQSGHATTKHQESIRYLISKGYDYSDILDAIPTK